jgi:hypothetical protein
VTIEFHRQGHKNLISAQCVNCSGHVVTTNDVIFNPRISSCDAKLQTHITVPFFVHWIQTSAMACKNFILL